MDRKFFASLVGTLTIVGVIIAIISSTQGQTMRVEVSGFTGDEISYHNSTNVNFDLNKVWVDGEAFETLKGLICVSDDTRTFFVGNVPVNPKQEVCFSQRGFEIHEHTTEGP